MNEYPKRIWIDNTILDEFDMERCPESDILYIRADLVNELVEALKGLAVHDFGANGWNDSAERYAIEARAVLKKLENRK